MEDAVHALMMAFSVLVFVMALSVVVYMFGQATTTADNLLYYADETNYYDNIELGEGQTDRIVDIDTVILTLYRYYKENFCVKIYDAPSGVGIEGELLQVFDVNLEGKVRKAVGTTDANATQEQKALKKIYNDSDDSEGYRTRYLFEAPWIGSTDDDSSIKTRVDLYINGSSGYINDVHVNYIDNKFYKIRNYNETVPEADRIYFQEEFVKYTYTGDTYVTDEGEILVEGAQPEDKIVIIYTATKYVNI